MDWNKFWGLFHRAWGKATSESEYDKETWNEMQRMLWYEQEKEKRGIKEGE
jgi:hypothetical protein